MVCCYYGIQNTSRRKDFILGKVKVGEKDAFRKKVVEMHQPGIEPGASAWQAEILPLNH
jgi:hypothetical protein